MAGGPSAYDRALETHLRRRGVAYVSVDQTRRALLPAGARPAVRRRARGADGFGDPEPLKTFDFVVYPRRENGRGESRALPEMLLVEVKGRRLPASRGGKRTDGAGPRPPGRMECWTTLDDVRSLATWRRLFALGSGRGRDGDAGRSGAGVSRVAAALVFVYRLDPAVDPSVFEEWFEHEGSAYGIRAVELDAYRSAMKTRSPRWRTVDLDRAAFEAVSTPLTVGGGPAA